VTLGSVGMDGGRIDMRVGDDVGVTGSCLVRVRDFDVDVIDSIYWHRSTFLS
jgi:hypothetical protein